MFHIILLLIILYITFYNFLLPQSTEQYTQDVATDRDLKLATKDALRKRCIKGGYTWKEGGDEFSYDCLHTRTTCLRDSVYPTYADEPPKYYEWRAEPGNDRCIIGNEGFREFCEKEGLAYEPETGKCKTTRPYCLSKGLPFCNGDCYVPPVQWLSEQIFGTTLGRTIAQASPERWITEGACRLDDKVKEDQKEK